MNRAEIRRRQKEQEKQNKVYTMTYEQIQSIRQQEYTKARQEILNKSDELASKIFKMMLVIPTNILVNDYWKKTAETRIPKFVEDCIHLYESWTSGSVNVEEMCKLTERYGKIKLIEEDGPVGNTLRKL